MNIIKQAPNGSKDILTVAPNRPVIDYLYDYDDQRDMETDIYVNNRKLERDEEFNYIMREGDLLRIVYRPSVTGAIAAVTAVLVLLAVSQTEDYTNNAGETSTSSNNSVSGQSNTVRKYEGIPSICGRVWSYPDLIANAIPEWVSNRKQVRELFLVSEGELQINRVRDSTTDLDDIAESSYTVYGPNTYPSDLYRIQFNDSVNGEELIAPDDDSLFFEGLAYGYRSDYNNYFDGSLSNITRGIDNELCFQQEGGIEITSSSTVVFGVNYNMIRNYREDIVSTDPLVITENPVFDKNEIDISGQLDIEIGDTVNIVSRTSVTAGEYLRLSESSYTVVSISKIGELYYLELDTTSLTIGTYTNSFIGILRARVSANSSTLQTDLGLSSGDNIDVSLYTNPIEIGFFIQGDTKRGNGGPTTSFDGTNIVLPNGDELDSTTSSSSAIIQPEGGTDSTIGPYTMPTTAEEIWFNVSATSGLQSDSGGEISVDVTFYAQQIDALGEDVGSPVSESVTLTGKGTGVLGQTVKLTGLGGERYKVYAIRDTNTFSGNAIQDVFWQEVFTVNSYDGSNFGDVTVIDVVTKASTTGTSSSRKINLDVTRKIGGVATTNFADYVVHFITEKGGYSLDYINTDELYEIADSLSDDLKEFSYTFDDADLTLAQIVQSICDVARVTCYRDGQQWRFTRDEAKPRTYMFNRRNLASGDNQAITLSTRQPQDYDGISLRYYNRDTEDYDNIYIKIDVDTQSFIVGEFGDNLKEIDLAGCANYAQALNRAHLEARKIVYQRKGVEDTALMDASNVSIGERVSWCDIFDGDIFDGEITGQDGTTYYTSEPFRPESGVTYYALITDEDDQPMATVEVIENPDDEKSFIATLTDAVLIADNYSIQLGSRYIIGSVDDIDDTDYTVMGRGGDSGNGLISLELVQYSDNIYEMD